MTAAMKAMVVHIHGIASACAAPPEVINHFLIANARMETRAAIGLAIPFCGARRRQPVARGRRKPIYAME
jgi:hypothetical protein